MKREKLEVGSKWEHRDGDVFTVEYVGKKLAICSYKDGEELTHPIVNFGEDYTPHIEFEWEKFVFTVETKKSYAILNNKDYELLYNYNRYRELVDTTELDWGSNTQSRCYNYYSKQDNKWSTHYSTYHKITGALYFSTEAHAKAFLKLAKENDCL